MLSKRKFRTFWIILVGALVLSSGAFEFYYNHLKSSPSLRAFKGLGYYTAKKADSVFTIAGKFGVSIAGLQQTNGLHSGAVRPGQVLAIPNKPSGDWYTITSGDCLYYIAIKYDVTIAALQQANMLKNDRIFPGQVIVIPASQAGHAAMRVASSPTVKTSAAEMVAKYLPNYQEKPLSSKSAECSLDEIIKEKGIANPWSHMVILVEKSAHTLSLYVGNICLKSYPVELGEGGLAAKEVEGDHKTPEGTFYIAEKMAFEPENEFLGTRWLRLSYPNVDAATRGIQKGLIDQSTFMAIMAAYKKKGIPPQYTALGGGVGIHGGSYKERGSNWTWGCIGLNNKDIEDFYDFVSVGTPIVIER